MFHNRPFDRGDEFLNSRIVHISATTNFANKWQA
jgi:hypothetical protein